MFNHFYLNILQLNLLWALVRLEGACSHIMGSIDAGILYIYDPSVSLMSSIEGDSIIERIQRLLGDEYDNYKESFEAIYKSDPLKNPQKF